MHLTPHLDSAAIQGGLLKCLPLLKPWAGDAFRLAEAPYATRTAILSGEGAARWGGRWNPPGLRAIYASLDPSLAFVEWSAQRRKAGMSHRRHLPLTQITLMVSLARVLDFRDPEICVNFALPIAKFVKERHVAQVDGDVELRAQALGRLAASQGLDALVIPSAQKSTSHNLVIYCDNLLKAANVAIHGRDYLLP